MILSPEERVVAESRIREINEQLRAIESVMDIEAWKQLFRERLALDRKLGSTGIGKDLSSLFARV